MLPPLDTDPPVLASPAPVFVPACVPVDAPAGTVSRTLAAGARTSLLEVELDTGRRHQIRAHLAFLGHPVVGDARYGTKSARMMLHALRLEVPHPSTGATLRIEAPAPREFRRS